MRTNFPKYRPTPEERKLVERFENETGYVLGFAEEVKDREGLRFCMRKTVEWYQEHINESCQKLLEALERL